MNNIEDEKAIYVLEGPGKYKVTTNQKKNSKMTRDFWSSAVCFAWIACGRISAVNYVGKNLWDYIPGQYIVKQAGGYIYNDEKNHIAANTKTLLENMKICE